MGFFHKHSSSTDEKHPDGPPDAPPLGPPPPAYPPDIDSKPPLSSQQTYDQPLQQQQYHPAPAAQAGFGTGSSSSSQPSTYAALLLSRSDRIRIIGFPGTIVQALDMAIKRSWAPGVQQQKAYDQASWEWKLAGNPWWGQGKEAVPSRRLLAHVLHALLENGWHLSLSTDLSKKSMDKDTLIFKSGPAVQRFIFPVSFNESDKIRLIDPPHDRVKQAFDAAIRGAWPLGVQEAREKEHGAYQMKLKGNPWWTSSGDQINYSRMLACSILSAMESQGFELLGSVDMSMAGGENQSELDTWFFVSKC
ncbi:uncharacterized protein MKK02DRAFT_39984 [Dioszegia hungarica]|uniref:Uncharacterized protein n=1 Tax=Dioszegia hungarica TaxID=4972 RepID=A0AA38HEI8_9TREE|nr:uncharacterized protein MKK02DRAFT_39984 [Dioszegia hungarica]KAI9639662.1 hypothetical protein MKK02DRAFT_39984 [Dioszegia hungarica]